MRSWPYQVFRYLATVPSRQSKPPCVDKEENLQTFTLSPSVLCKHKVEKHADVCLEKLALQKISVRVF